MSINLQKIFLAIQEKISDLPINELLLSSDQNNNLSSHRIEELIEKNLSGLSQDEQTRIRNEFKSWGPLNTLIADPTISEILVNGPLNIWYEKSGKLCSHPDLFFSELSFRNCIERICQTANVHISVEQPFVDGKFLDFRLSLIGVEMTHSKIHFCLRRHPRNPWSFQRLAEQEWCGLHWLPFFNKIIREKRNCLIIGSTGSGKTSVLNSFLNLLEANERAVIIEDTNEISLPNTSSLKLLTREDPHQILPPIDQSNLVKRALRLRPDRIIMGEVRGSEAKDFLMALATGHSGSFGTLHAQDANQALIRLEMLIQMGAPQWNLLAIRRLIQLSLDYIVVTGRTDEGERKLMGVSRLCSLEDHGFLVESVTQPHL